MRKKRDWFVAVAVLAAVLVVVTVLALAIPQKTPVSPPRAADAAGGAVTPESGASVPATEKSVSVATPAMPVEASASAKPFVLPPLDAPLRDTFAELEREARKGNAPAACRLAVDANHCWGVRQTSKWGGSRISIAEMADIKLGEGELDKRIDAALAWQEQQARKAAECEGVDVSVRKMFEYDGMAAAVGDSAARNRYLEGMWLMPGAVLRYPELLGAYRANAYGYFTAGLEAGDLALLRSWHFSAVSGDQLPLATVLPAPWNEAGFTQALLEQLSAEQREGLRRSGGLTVNGPEPTAAQRAEAERVYAAYFAHSPPPVSAWDMFSSEDDGEERQVLAERRRCESLGP